MRKLINESYRLTLLLARYYLSLIRDEMKKETLKKVIIRGDVIINLNQDADNLIKETLSDIYDSKPKNFEIRMELARLYGHLKIMNIAMSILQENLIDCLKNEQLEQLEYVKGNMKRITGSDLIVHFALAEAYYKLEDYDNAAEEFSNVLKIDKYHTRALIGMGNVLLAERKYDIAIKAYTTALSLDPDDVKILRGIGIASRGSGELSQASKYLLKRPRNSS